MGKKITTLLIALITIFTFSCTAFAAEETKEIFTIDRSYNMAVSILFDKEMPVVSFTAPDGTVIDGSSLSSDSGEDWVQFYIPDAAPGIWMITYDRLSNTEFEINYSSYMDSITIEEFSFGELNGNYLPATFTVRSESDQSYRFEIYAVITDNQDRVIGERLLLDGWAEMNQTRTDDVYIGDLADYGSYKLRLDVWQKDGVEEAFDSIIADGSFTITGHSGGELSPDFKVEADLTEGLLKIDWTETAWWGDYLLAIFNDAVSSSEPFYYSEIMDGRTSADAIFDPACEALRIELTHRNYGSNSLTRTKVIPVSKQDLVIKSLTGEFTSSTQAMLEYEAAKTITADITVNDKTDIINLSGSGSFSVELTDSYNEVAISYSLDDPLVKYIIRYTYSVDNIPPILRLPENKTALRVRDADYVLAGVTEPGALLNISGNDVAVNEDGTFAHSIPLNIGENIIKVIATDTAGNVTAQDVIINRISALYAEADGKGGFFPVLKKYLPMLLSFIASIVLLLSILLVRRGYGKTSNKSSYRLKTIRNITVIVGSLLLCGEGYCLWKYLSLRKLASGEDYFELALESVEKAYQVLKDLERYKQLLVYIAIAIVVCALLTFILNKAIKGDNGRKEKVGIPAGKAGATAPSVDSLTKKAEGKTAGDQTEYICPGCGAKYDHSVKFCRKCGEKLL